MKTSVCHTSSCARRSGFTLVEVLIAVFILAIGMIMVITVFPVGGEWTRQATESTMSQAVAQNALSIIQGHYPSTNTVPGNVISQQLVPVPGLTTTIPVGEMCYQFGNDVPCPANPNKASYFWTALMRLTPSQPLNVNNKPLSSTAKYDVYILVFKKGSIDQTFPTTINVAGSSYSEISGTRDPVNYPGQPAIAAISYPNPATTGVDSSSGKMIIPGPPTYPLFPAIDEFGIGLVSGTVFRQGTYLNTATSALMATPRPMLQGMTSPTSNVTEPVIIGIPAFGASVSPLVYVYQTTIQWKSPPLP